MGSRHPTTDLLYELNYGYLPNTTGGDGEEIDVYLLGSEGPIQKAKALVIAVIIRMDDQENKLVATLNHEQVFSKAEIRTLTRFQEQYFETMIILD